MCLSLPEHSCSSRVEGGGGHECLAPLTALVATFSKSRSLWNKFKKTQMEIPDREEEHNDNQGESDFDENFEVGGEGEHCLKKAL